jgi:hypothetical protein
VLCERITMTNQDSLHPLHDELLDFHSFIINALAKITASKSSTGKVTRASSNAAVALELALHGESPDTNLRKARVAARTCAAVLRVLSVEGHFSAEVYAEIRRRLDRIVAGVVQLATLPPHAWHSASRSHLRLRRDSSRSGTSVELSVIRTAAAHR